MLLCAAMAVMTSSPFCHNTFVSARERTIYLAAVEVEWDYAPSGRNLISGEIVPAEGEGALDLSKSHGSSGSSGSSSNSGSHKHDSQGRRHHPHSKVGNTAKNSGASKGDDNYNTSTASAAAAAASTVSRQQLQQGGEIERHTPSLWLTRTANRIGRRYLKAVYRAYTDESFATQVKRTRREAHLGLQGPVIRTVVGDTVKVVFRNMASHPLSVHVHGLRYTREHEGHAHGLVGSLRAQQQGGTKNMDSSNNNKNNNKNNNNKNMNNNNKNFTTPTTPTTTPAHAGDAVGPGDTVTYKWEVDAAAGPGPNDGSSVGWLYHSHVKGPRDVNSGLFGVVTVARATFAADAGADSAGAGVSTVADPSVHPAGVDRELFLGAMTQDESASLYAEANLNHYLNGTGSRTLSLQAASQLWRNDDFAESNRMHSFNGRLYGNLGGLTMAAGERVRWYIYSLGSQLDTHSVHWHGNTVLDHGRRLDAVTVVSGKLVVVDMVPRAEGKWMLQCHVNHHMHGGMFAEYEVTATGSGVDGAIGGANGDDFGGSGGSGLTGNAEGGTARSGLATWKLVTTAFLGIFFGIYVAYVLWARRRQEHRASSALHPSRQV